MPGDLRGADIVKIIVTDNKLLGDNIKKRKNGEHEMGDERERRGNKYQRVDS
jgi:hypothetical protein